jgi:hypothetical protein
MTQIERKAPAVSNLRFCTGVPAEKRLLVGREQTQNQGPRLYREYLSQPWEPRDEFAGFQSLSEQNT